MKTALTTKINWTKSVIILTLLCSAFSFNAAAQSKSDKPLDAKSLAVLIAELKAVVAKSAPDEKESALVAERWDKRKDLRGKSKTAVINLLYQDVKSVVKDSGVLYQIFSMFSFYKRMPDKQFSGQTQPRLVFNSKPQAVEQLMARTYSAHPYVGIEAQLAKLPGTKNIKEEEENARKVRIEIFEEALKVNSKLTPDQKTFVRANYDRLSKTINEIIDETIEVNFPTEQWVYAGMEKSYAAKFSLKELNELINFFESENGQQVLKYIRQMHMAELITGNGGKLDFTEADKAGHDKFVATALGKKFIAAYITETIAFEQNKEVEVRRNVPNADGFAILEPANLNSMFDNFVAENYKK